MKNKWFTIIVALLLLGLLGLLGFLAVQLFGPSTADKSASTPAAQKAAVTPTSASSSKVTTEAIEAPAEAPVADAAATAPEKEADAADDENPAPVLVEPGPLAARHREIAATILRKQIERREQNRVRKAKREAAKNGNGAKISNGTKNGGTASTKSEGTYTPLTPEQIDAEVAAQLAELAEREPLTSVGNFEQSVQDVTEMWRDADIEITADIAKEFKAEFDKMSEAEKVENIHEALNRFDDNYLECLKAIVTDASEPAEVLEKTVYDLGNRDWDNVRPIFEEIAANPQHSQNAAAKEWLEDHPADPPAEAPAEGK